MPRKLGTKEEIIKDLKSEYLKPKIAVVSYKREFVKLEVMDQLAKSYQRFTMHDGLKVLAKKLLAKKLLAKKLLAKKPRKEHVFTVNGTFKGKKGGLYPVKRIYVYRQLKKGLLQFAKEIEQR